jgi:hypothetical protein
MASAPRIGIASRPFRLELDFDQTTGLEGFLWRLYGVRSYAASSFIRSIDTRIFLTQAALPPCCQMMTKTRAQALPTIGYF